MDLESVNDILEENSLSWASMGGKGSSVTPKKQFVKASRTGTPRNTIDSSGINGELGNIQKGVCPFSSDNNGAVSVTDAIELCQKAYWNVAIFRSTIDIQSEFANSKLVFRCPNKTVENFFTSWYDKIDGWTLGDQAFREWFRSGNVFLYRVDGDLTWKEYRKITRAATEETDTTKKIPIRYIVLNPKDMRCIGASSFVDAEYGKLLNDYELKRYKSDKLTDKDKEFLNSLDADTRKAIKTGTRPIIKLDADKLTAIFCAKQDYEPMAVPMYYPVLSDINLKLEFKKVEQVIARTVDYAVLLITCGEKERTATDNARLRDALSQLFSSESVGRVLVSDYTTKGEFIIPDLNKIFGAEKYKVVNDDIANGLMNIMWGEEKFANSMVKIQVFLERLNQAREAYINKFLKPEMERIAGELGFTKIPTVEWQQINLNNEVEYMKIYVHLAELGLLSPDELFIALKQQQLPLKEDSILSQKEFKTHKDGGLYEPLLNKKEEDAGRPDGTKAPKSSKKTGPIGASFSVSKIRDTIHEITSLSQSVENEYKNHYEIQRLSKKHKELCWNIAESIIINEPNQAWETSVAEYVKTPKLSGEVTNQVLDISVDHNVSPLVGALLFNSQITQNTSDETV